MLGNVNPWTIPLFRDMANENSVFDNVDDFIQHANFLLESTQPLIEEAQSHIARASLMRDHMQDHWEIVSLLFRK